MFCSVFRMCPNRSKHGKQAMSDLTDWVVQNAVVPQVTR